MARQARGKWYGPYGRPGHWRAIYRQGRGTTDSFALAGKTKDEAAETIRELNRVRQERTVQSAIDEYQQHLEAKGNAEAGVRTSRFHLEGFFGPMLDGPLAGIREADARDLYTEYQQGRTPATHRSVLRRAKAFLTWCAAPEQRFLPANPAAEIKPIGKPHKGKQKHTFDEAAQFFRACYARIGEEAPLAILTTLNLGLRASETLRLEVRDIDNGGRLAWVRGTKTAASDRRVEIDEWLRYPLLDRCARMKAGWLFPTAHTWTRPDMWLNEQTKAMCKAAGVPEVCTQALRGLHATAAVEAGATAHLVAAMLGNSVPICRGHYIAEGAEDRQRQRQLLTVITGGKR